jgi:hypothetical protein
VYSSAAVAVVPGLGPTVYLGSYDGNFYAFDARSGAIRWKHPAGGKISGSPTIVGNVVYYSNLAAKTTVGVNARTGRQVFSFPDGAFNPIIADYGALYLVGYTKLYQLLPGRRPHHRRSSAASRSRGRHAKHRRTVRHAKKRPSRAKKKPHARAKKARK